ncbi:hypothetical protein IFM89_023272 [Coptis chinensis]|uniref:Protein FAR1-RELATED SEQUENCE n=1 Tax=Coptis chinensis TaxID=261450 RepID=A0A835LG46_9MAGN|nr:hypothetical protein IFM89_023272 [Coptis chinensis]
MGSFLSFIKYIPPDDLEIWVLKDFGKGEWIKQQRLTVHSRWTVCAEFWWMGIKLLTLANLCKLQLCTWENISRNEDEQVDISVDSQKIDCEMDDRETQSVQVENQEFGSPSKVTADSMETPYIGMTFETNEDAKEYYQSYAHSKGFSTLACSIFSKV